MIKLTFLGDIMCDKKMIELFKLHDNNYDFTSLFSQVVPLFRDSDYVFGNLETPISYDNKLLTKERYSFSTPIEFAIAVHDAGVNFVSTANNHCLDRGITGISSTIAALNQIGLKHTGVFDDKVIKETPLIIEVKGLKLGISSYTYGTNAFSNHQYLKRREHWKVNLFQNQELSNLLDRICYVHRYHPLFFWYKLLGEIRCKGNMTKPVYERRESDRRCINNVKHDIKALKNAGAELIIMYSHVGGQYNITPTNYTVQLVDKLLQYGVNIVVGCHEHVVHGGILNRTMENIVATYSLGNFVGSNGTYSPPYDKLSEYSVAWNVYINEDKVIAKTSFYLLKSIVTANGKLKIVPCVDLLGSSLLDNMEKCKLLNEMKFVAETFSGMKFDDKTVMDNKELFL